MPDAPGALECWHVLLWLQRSHLGHMYLIPIWWYHSFLSHFEGHRARAGPRADVGALAICVHFCGCRVSPSALQWRLVRGVRPMCASTQLEELALSIPMAVGVSLGAQAEVLYSCKLQRPEPAAIDSRI